MKKSSVRPTDGEIERVFVRYSDMLFRMCFTALGNNSDAEDAVSNTFLKFITNSPVFRDEEHEKAWFLRVASNLCKDSHRFRKRHDYVNLDEISDYCRTQPECDILEAVMRLPLEYKTVVYMHYIEGYKSGEIAAILSLSPAAVRKRLQYARELLKIEYGRENGL